MYYQIMKKSLLFIMSMAMLATFGCSDDDNKAPWEELPSGPITGADAMITFNGDRSYGSVQIKADNSSKGVINVVNVLPGYPEVTMAVDMAQQPDGSFNVTGATTLDTPPCMLPSSKSDEKLVIYNLSVEGNVTTQGKADMNFKAVLADNVQNHVTGTWVLAEYLPLTPEGMANAPVQVSWVTKSGGVEMDARLSAMASLLAGNIVYQMLKSVTFSPDGNVTALYSSGFDLVTFMEAGVDKQQGRYIHVNNDWKESPRNLAFWYSPGNYLCVIPYMPNIMAQIAIDNGEDPDLNNGALPEMEKQLLEKLAQLGVDVSVLMENFEYWNKNGIPLQIVRSDYNSMSLVLDEKMIDSVVKAFIPALDKLDEKLAEMIAADPNDPVVKLLMTEIMPELGINKLVDLGSLWINDTESFTIALKLNRAQ
ncbi:DUF4925 domain-containing protein [Muribaculum sp. NM65_B17]|jgi:hypothetical protein|nr:DUF4925 domain-containing protein [Muribaculum sp. NM65_B17]THG43265.1 DUF4925 domain-containing protein [Muribaculaceae bacterium]